MSKDNDNSLDRTEFYVGPFPNDQVRCSDRFNTFQAVRLTGCPPKFMES